MAGQETREWRSSADHSVTAILNKDTGASAQFLYHKDATDSVVRAASLRGWHHAAWGLAVGDLTPAARGVPATFVAERLGTDGRDRREINEGK